MKRKRIEKEEALLTVTEQLKPVWPRCAFHLLRRGIGTQAKLKEEIHLGKV